MILPKSWNDITVEQFRELKSLDNEGFDSLFSYEIEALSIIANIEIETIEEMDVDELTELITKISFIKKQPSNKYKKKIDIYTHKGINTLTLGEFIDLEHYCKDDYIVNLPTICAILYRKTMNNVWGNEEVEPYRFNPLDREYVFNDLPITQIYGVITEYLKFREDFMKTYENLFQPTFEVEEDEEMDIEDKKEEEEEKRISKWSWESIIWSLANEDITKADHVTDLPLIFCFNFLSMKNDLQV